MKPNRATRFLIPAVLLATATLATASGTMDPENVVFSQNVVAYDSAGQPLPSHAFISDQLDLMPSTRHSLGGGRELVIHTDLPSNDGSFPELVAGVVRRCYEHLEGKTGRTIRGGMLLYLPSFDGIPDSYSFSVDVDRSRWAQVRLAPIDAGLASRDPLLDHRLAELLLDTLPHELVHGLIESVPTVRHDTTAEPCSGTRWFIEGVCETLAKTFSAAERPEVHRRLLMERHVDTVLDRPGVRPALMSWRQDGVDDPALESDLYGAAMLMVMAWTEHVPLSRLLEGLAADGGGHLGPDLLGRLLGDTGDELLDVMNHASDIGHALIPPIRISSASPAAASGRTEKGTAAAVPLSVFRP